MQRLLSRAWERYSANEIVTDSSWEPWQASRMRSLGCKGNRLLSWLTGVPAGPDSTLADATLFVCLRWTLGLPLPSGVLAGNCVCSRGDSSGMGRHEASCKYGGGRQAHHNMITATFRRILAEAGARPFRGEMLLRQLGISPPGLKMTMDAGAVGFPHLRLELFDVSLVDGTQVKFVSGRPGAAAAYAAQAKVKKYGPCVRASGARFTPLCGDLYGWVDKGFRKALGRLAHMRAQFLADSDGQVKLVKSRISRRWQEMLSFSFLRGLYLRIAMHRTGPPSVRTTALSPMGLWHGDGVWDAGLAHLLPTWAPAADASPSRGAVDSESDSTSKIQVGKTRRSRRGRRLRHLTVAIAGAVAGPRTTTRRVTQRETVSTGSGPASHYSRPSS